MNAFDSKPKIAIIGKGALGLLYGSLSQDALGDGGVCFVMDAERRTRHAGDVYTVNGAVRTFRDLLPEEAGPVDLVLIAVKSPALDSALDLVEPLLGEDTVIVPVLNGITSERRCAARFGWERVVACVAAAMDATTFGTNDMTYSKAGRLIIGALGNTPTAAVERAAAVLEAAGITRVVAEDIERELWMKFMINVGVNQVCATYTLTYEQLYADEESEYFRSYIAAMREVIAISKPAGIELTEEDMNFYVDIIHSLEPSSTPSLAQDCLSHRPTELEEFSGEVIRRAEEYGIYVPCNRFLHRRIEQIVASYSA